MASCQAAFQANMVYGHRPSPFDIWSHCLYTYLSWILGHFLWDFLVFVVILRLVVFFLSKELENSLHWGCANWLKTHHNLARIAPVASLPASHGSCLFPSATSQCLVAVLKLLCDNSGLLRNVARLQCDVKWLLQDWLCPYRVAEGAVRLSHSVQASHMTTSASTCFLCNIKKIL